MLDCRYSDSPRCRSCICMLHVVPILAPWQFITLQEDIPDLLSRSVLVFDTVVTWCEKTTHSHCMEMRACGFHLARCSLQQWHRRWKVFRYRGRVSQTRQNRSHKVQSSAMNSAMLHTRPTAIFDALLADGVGTCSLNWLMSSTSPPARSALICVAASDSRLSSQACSSASSAPCAMSVSSPCFLNAAGASRRVCVGIMWVLRSILSRRATSIIPLRYASASLSSTSL